MGSPFLSPQCGALWPVTPLSAWALRGFFVPFPAPALAWTRGAGGLEEGGDGEDTPAHVSRMGGRFFAYYGWAAGASSCSMGPKYSSR